jgi:hypothetical protein
VGTQTKEKQKQKQKQKKKQKDHWHLVCNIIVALTLLAWLLQFSLSK